MQGRLTTTSLASASPQQEQQHQMIPWFGSIICCELLFQVPFFFIAIHIINSHSSSSPLSQKPQQQDQACRHYPGWFKTLCLIYGSHVSTTLVPIVATFWTSTEMSTIQKVMTIAIYSPYLLFPMVLLYKAASDDVVEAFKYFSINKTHISTRKDKQR
jgi:hypothetical protein